MYIPLQTPVPPNSPVERLVRMLDMLCAVIAARRAGGVLTVPLFFLLWKRVRHTAVKAIKLAAGIAAGIPPPITRPRKTPRPPRPPILRLPREFAWIVKVVPGTAVYGFQLEHLLAQPELAPLVADARFRRMINPLCRMLAIPRLPPLPKRQVTPPATDPPPRPELVGERAATVAPLPATGNAGSGDPPAATAHTAPRPLTNGADCPTSHDRSTPAPARHRCPPQRTENSAANARTWAG